jgi:hypothetical protein
MLPVFNHDEHALGANSVCYTFPSLCQSSTLIFLLAAIPACLSSVCLERTLVGYSVPLSPLLLHAYLVPMQCVFGLLLAPIGRHFQHPTQPLYNISRELEGMGKEVSDGLKCIFLGSESGFVVIDISDENWCKPLFPLLVLFVAVSFSFHVLTLYVIKRGTEFCLRVCTALAIPFAWVSLVVYDLYFPPHVGKEVPTQFVVSWFSKASVLLVVLGILFHQTVKEPGTDFVLTSPFEERDRRFIEIAAERHRTMLLEAKARREEERQEGGHFAQGAREDDSSLRFNAAVQAQAQPTGEQEQA